MTIYSKSHIRHNRNSKGIEFQYILLKFHVECCMYLQCRLCDQCFRFSFYSQSKILLHGLYGVVKS